MNGPQRMRVRFAPSPTGYLHVGGARTALFNWLLARQRGGVFVLRIEDTDRERSSQAMTAAILDGMTWLGLTWDEGPLHQADGVERHRAAAVRLLEAGAAYRCFCSAETLKRKRGEALERNTSVLYDRECLLRVPPEASARRAAAGEPHTIRFRVPDGETVWDDAVHGRIRFANADLDDFIILRTDSTPIYNLAVVSDDIDMRITHVIRGDDHLSNTPKQILLYHALSAPQPQFAHLPMILGPDGKRLSKRHGATAIGEYRERGFLPEAMVNFLALLGWSPGTDEEVFTVNELIERFSLEQINKKSAIFDPQKLLWLNGQHLSRMAAETLRPLVGERLQAAGLASAEQLDAMGATYLHLIDLLKARARTLDDFAPQAVPYFVDRIDYEPDAVAKHWKDAESVRERLAALAQRLGDVEPWNAATLEPAVRGLAESLGVGAGKVIHPLRIALTGMAVSAGIFEVLTVMGRERTLRRIEQARRWLEGRGATASQVGGDRN